jgi:iron complex outermembrane receptor protein
MSTLLLALLLAQEQEPPKPKTPQEPEREVVIIGQRRESDVLDVPSGVTVVTARQIQESGAANVREVLERTPSFFTQSPNKGAYDAVMDIRGFNNGTGTGQRTLVLVDGRKTNSVTGSSTDWAAIPLENIERVEIVRGPAAALYGDGALAGVVNIITKKGGPGTFSHLAAEGGAWNTFKASANVGGTYQKSLFDLFAGLESAQGYRDNSEYQGENVTARLEAPLGEALRGFVKVGHHDDDRERPGSLSKAEIAALGRRASSPAGFPGTASRQESYLDTGLTQGLGDLGEVSLFLNHTRSDGHADFGGFFLIEDASDISMLQLKHVVSPRLLEGATFTTGTDLSYERADADSGSPGSPFDESEYRRRLLGIYEHVEVRPWKVLILTASLRYDRALLDLDRDLDPLSGESLDEQRAFDQLSPHAGATFRVIEEVSLYAAWGRTFKYPTRDQLVGFMATNPRLDPERSHSYETGVRFWSGRWGFASVSAFRMEVKDEIYFDPTFVVDTPFGPFPGYNVNFDEVVHQGLETEVRATPWEWLELFATHTYTRAIVTDADNPAQEGKQHPVTPRLMGTVGGTLRAWGARLTLSGRYVGDRYLVNDFENSFDKLDSYWVLDAKVSYTWEALTAFVAVYNAADREYFDSGGTNGRFNPAPERSWVAGGEVRF